MGLEPTIYRTQGKNANHYTTDEPTIYHTQGEHANHYTTNEPTIYHTQGEHANHYTTDAVSWKIPTLKIALSSPRNSLFIGHASNPPYPY
jgi:lipopolysaccharide export system protein LptC